MAVTNNFSASSLDLNGIVGLTQPTALVWGPDGRLYVTEVDGDVKVLTVAFGDPDPSDDDQTAQFYVTDAVTINDVKAIQNYNDDGSLNGQTNRQVTGIDVTNQYDAEGNLIMIDGAPAVTMYVTSSDSRIGAGGSGNDAGLDTNSGIITKLTQTGPDSWDAVDIVRGLARSEENHALNGLEVIQEVDGNGILVSERLIVANGGNANTGAPSNNFAGQQEQPYSAAILEVDLDALNDMPVLTDATGRNYVYDLPTLDDPTRDETEEADTDPHGGNDGSNSAKITADSPVQIYSPGYRNAYDVEVTDDGRVFTYDNGANNSWGGRPVGEAGSTAGQDFMQAIGYIALNLNNGEGNSGDDINLEAWNPGNQDQLHEVTRSDDLNGSDLSVGAGGTQTFDVDGLTYVYGGHPNPTRAEGSRAGLLFSPEDGTDNAFLLVSNEDSYGNGGESDYDEVIEWLKEVELANPTSGIYGVEVGDLTKKVISVTPGVLYDLYLQADGSALIVEEGEASPGGTYIGSAGLPSDIAEIVVAPNAIEGNYLEGGQHDGSLDSGGGSINGLTEYTSTILDDPDNGVKMSGALIATQLNSGGNLIVIGREEDGTVSADTSGTYVVAEDRTTVDVNGAPLGISALGDDVNSLGLTTPFQGSIWTAVYSGSGVGIEIYQPNNGAVLLAGSDVIDPLDNDLDGLSDIVDPFEFSATNGYALDAGQSLVLDFNPQNLNFPSSFAATGLLGAALDGVTPNQDERTAAENFGIDEQQDGLFNDGGNILPGGNAPIFQIKNVVDGSVVGAGNTARDAMHTGVHLADDVERLVSTVTVKNWLPEANGGEQAGQLTGLMFGDGTQANFVRVVFGSVNGAPGLEVGYEIGDANYTTVAQLAIPGLSNVAATTIDLRLEIDIEDGFAVSVYYKLLGESDFTEVALTDGGTPGFSLPTGVLQDVLTGDHSISDNGTTLTSGAAIGFLAEDTGGDDINAGGYNGLEAIDFTNLEIEAFGNEIAATTAAEVAQAGTAGLDTVIYEGTDTDLALDESVENFDGSGSAADYNLTANDSDNVIVVGEGANTITTGEGADSIQGTLAQLAGDTITDFSTDDEIIINGVTVSDLNVTYEAGSAVIKINEVVEITLDGPEFEDFDPADGPGTFEFEDIDGGGVRLVAKAALTPFLAINSGGPAVSGITLREQVVDFVSDLASAPKIGFDTGASYKSYTNGNAQSTDFADTDLDDILAHERSGDFDVWSYNIDAPDGEYLVDLYFAEIYHGLQTAADPDDLRVFDVEIEGTAVLTDFDIIDDAGATATQVLKTFQVTVTDGQLNLDFIKTVDQAKLSGLVVWSIGGTFVPPADETAPEIVDIVVANPASDQDSPRDLVITLSDDGGFETADFAALDGSELSFTDIVPGAVGAPVVEISLNGQTATLTYTLQPPSGSWPTGQGSLNIAADAFGDAAGNTTAAADAVFFVEPNLNNLIAGDVALAINVGPTTNTTDTSLAGDDKNTYGGAITGDTIINGINLEADNPDYYTPTTKTGNNIDGKAGSTGSNLALDGSALHTYRDAASGSFTVTYPIENGIYVVELWFAELFHTTGGNRQGDYTINGEVFELDFDAFTEAGAADTAVSITKNIIVTNGEIVIDVNADTGEPGFNAIVVYDAIPSDLPPTVSVSDVIAAEGDDATITFSRIGDLSEDVTVEFSLTPDTAGAEDFGAAAPLTAVILAGETSATVVVPIVDDEEEEPAESFGVSITSVTNTSADAVVSPTGASATVTITANDQSVAIPDGGALFSFDFEGVSGEALAVGGFDGALGTANPIDEATSEVTGGKLVVQTAEGDINDGADNASINDFTKAVDVSDPALNELYLTTRFDNPFTESLLLSQGVTGTTIPNYIQQGIVFGTGSQLAGEQLKLVWGGVAGGTGTQIWSKGVGVDQQAPLADMIEPGKTLFDVASVELSLEINKSAGTVGQWVTLYDGTGAIIGGARPEATDGFFTVAPVALPAAVLANLVSSTEASHFGVTSSDNSNPIGGFTSFEASWDSLSLTSPQFTPVEGPDEVDGVLFGDFGDTGATPTDVGVFENGSNVVTAQQVGDDDGPLGRDRDYFTFEVPEGQVLTQIQLNGYDNETVDDVQGFMAIQAGTVVTTDPVTGAGLGDLLGALVFGEGVLNNNLLQMMAEGGVVQAGFELPGFDLPLEAGSYTVWLNQGADLPTTVTLDFVIEDRPADVTLSIADVGDVVENGDFGVTALAFEVTASDAFDGTITVTYDTAADTGLTQDVTFVSGAGALTVLVDNDDIDNGAEAITLTLVSAVDAIGTNTVGVSAAAATGEGAVTEDDTASAVGKGAVQFALNVGGGTFTDESGVTYEADDDANWVSFNGVSSDSVANQPANGDYTGDGIGNADDTVYLTERYGGSDTSAPLTFERTGIPSGDYILTLKLAEIYNPVVSRIFDITVNGVLIADDLDLLNTAGLDVAADIDVNVTIPDSGDGTGTLTIAGDPSVDNAKFNGFVLYEAAGSQGQTDVTISVSDVAAGENSGVANVVFTREGDTTSDVTITFAVADGAGVAGVDYETPAGTTVTILAGETTASVPVTLIDNPDEATEVKDFTVSITDVATAGGESSSLGTASATVTIDDDEAFDPADIDGDGILNVEDPFAYDAENGLGNVLTVGGSFRQDFDVDTADVFSEDAGFTGIFVNTKGAVSAGTSETDPYGDRTTEATSFVEGGVLKVTASDDDTNGTATGINNRVKDNYISGVDVSGVDVFSVETKVANPWPTITDGQNGIQYASLGLHIGAGGTDDYVKLVYGVRNNAVNIEINSQGSASGPNVLTTVDYGVDATEAASDIIFRFDITKSSTSAEFEGLPTLIGYVTLLDSAGAELQTIVTVEKQITGSFAQAIEGNNPLTGGTGGIAYGISHTAAGQGTGNDFTGEWDYIEIYAPDNAPEVDAGVAAQVATENTAINFVLPVDVFKDDNGVANLTLSATLDDDTPLPTWLSFDAETGTFTGTPADGDGSVTIKVTADDGTNPPVSTSFELTVNDIPGPFIWYADADGDGVGTAADQVTDYVAPGEPGDYVLSDLGDDADDTDATIYPDAPEINDGKDNDQDGDIDEDNQSPVAGNDDKTALPDQVANFTRTELLSNDSDPDGDPLTFALVPDSGVNGIVALDPETGIVSFTPDSGFEGAASFEYTIADDFGGLVTQTVNINVSADGGFSFNLLEATNADTGSYTNEDKASGVITVNEATHEITVAGNAWKSVGLDSLITAQEGEPLPEAFTITEGMQLWVSVNSPEIPELLAIGFDSDNNYKNDGTAIFQLGGTDTTGWFDQTYNTYNPTSDVVPGEEVLYKLSLDGLVGMSFEKLVLINDQDAAPATASSIFSDIRIVTVAETNTAPVAVEDALLMESDDALVVAAADLLVNDSDADGDALTLTAVGNPTNGTVSLINGLITFEAAEGYSGPASFEYTISDPSGATSVTTVNVNVLAPGGGDIVTAVDFNANAIESYDTQDGKPGTGYEISPDGSSLTLDGNVWKKTALTGGDYIVTEDSVLRFDMTVHNPSGEIVAISLENDNAYRTKDDVTFQLYGSQNFAVHSIQDYNGQNGAVGETVSYEISLAEFAGRSFSTLAFINDDDVNGTSNVQFANVQLVEELGTGGEETEAPEIFGDVIPDQVVVEDLPFEISLPFFDLDTPFEDLVFTVTNPPAFLELLEGNVIPDGVLIGEASNDDVGDYSFAVTATDPEGNSAVGTLNLTVQNTNDAPELTGVYGDVEVIINNEILLELPTGLFSDIDVGTVLIYTAEGLPEGVTIDPDTGAISGTPLESGDFEITIIASDGPAEDPNTLSASTTFTMDIASGPPRESVLIEAEDFTAFTDPNVDVEGFFTEFAGTASGQQLIRLDVYGEGSVSTELDAAGVAPGFYDISVIHFDENDGESAFTLKLDLGDGSEPTVIGSYTMDRTDLPGQGGTTQSANINEAVFQTVNIPAGAQLIIEGVAETRDEDGIVAREVLRIDAVRFDPIDNTPPTIDTPATAIVEEGNTLALDVDATDLEGSEVFYAITGGDDAALFTIDPSTGVVSFLAAPDFETPLDADGDNVYDVIVEASDGDVAAEQTLAITVANLEEVPVFSSPTAVDAAENDTAAATVAAVDPDGAAITYALAGTGADEALFAVDPNTGVVTFLAAPDFETPGDANLDGVYEVSVTADDGTSAVTTDLQVTVTDENDAPVAVVDPAAQPVIIDAPLSLSIVGLFSDQDAADTLTYTIVSGAPAGITGIVEGALVGTPTEIGAFSVVIEATDGVAAPVQTTLVLNVDAADNTFGRVAPSQDLDEDTVVNSADPDVDGDGIANEDDSFAYDADNGALIADGESIELTFDVNGTPYQNGFTGLLQGGIVGTSDLADFDEDSGDTTVADGVLSNLVSDGDTGGNNDPEDDYQLGVKNADFTVEARVINPFETQAAVSYDQIGIHVGIDSTDFVKFVFGNAIEFSSRTDNVEVKATGGNQVLPAGLTTSDFSAVDVTLTVNSTSATAATITAVATFLDGNGAAIAGATGISFGSLAVTGALAAALSDEAVGVGAGFTQAHAGSSAPFVGQLDSFKVTATDGGSIDPTSALAVFDGEDLFTGASYGSSAVGSAVLEVMTGNNNVQSSNFGNNSFELTNTGDKKISAVFIDVTGALYQDSVFDPDGAGGDAAFKDWGINTDGGTGAEIVGGEGGYFLPGQDPDPNTTGTGIASNGGYKGALIAFNGASNGFENGEMVGFSGDMDPNSIAGLLKSGTNGVDTGATNGWDVGGISGHEIIGSTFTILFDDGTTASGQLASDGSTAGSQGLAAQGDATVDAPTLVVNGFAAGETGTYGGELPSVLVTGDPGSTVRITMTKGFDPVENTSNGIDDLVDGRLDRYDFKVSNSFDNQTVDVVIGTDGTFDASGLFDYDDTLSNGGTFTGSDVADIGFVASVIDTSNNDLSISPVTSPIYLTNEGGPVVGDPIGNDGTNAVEVFAGESDLITSATYGSGANGSAVLEIMVGDDNIEASNYGANSFQVTNTGDKKISAVFIDVSEALFQDAVFDPDGQGGDSTAKVWAVNSAGGTGAYIGGGTGGYFLPGQAPLANTTGTGIASDGGYKGALVKFTDFNNGETAGFSGDMDPNSIAGLVKANIDGTAIDSWDVGGISGHELIGSHFTVLFDDGTTASGQLASDGSASGSQALASQSLAAATTPTLEVNGVAAGGTGTYGVTQPTIIVTGDVGDLVRITMTKGFNPVVETSNGIAQLVEDRLDRYDFKANNNFDTQTVDVTIGADGTFDATGLFDYDDAVANNKADGSFAGDDVAQIGFVASVIDPANNDLAISAVTAPIYLTNDGGPVVGDPVTPFEGFYEIIGSGNNARFKIQVEDTNGSGGTTPPGDWSYFTEADDDGNQGGSQGTGYYVWKDGATTGTNAPQGILEYEIYIPEGDEGVYSFRFRASRDPGTDSDQANDIWLKIDDDAEALQVNETDSVSSGGFVKVFGAGTSSWGNSGNIDSVSEEEANFKASFDLSAGFHTISLAGRSGGYAVDYFDIYKGTGGFPATGSSNSPFSTTAPGEVGEQIISTINASSDDWEGIGGAGSGDLEFGVNGLSQQSVGMRFTDIDIPEDRVISEAYFQFQANGSYGDDGPFGPAAFTIQIEDTESAATYSNGSKPDSRDYLDDDFDWVPTQDWVDDGIYRTGDISDLIEAVIGNDGVENGELAFRVTGTGQRAAHSFDSDGTAPQLIIVFEDDFLI